MKPRRTIRSYLRSGRLRLWVGITLLAGVVLLFRAQFLLALTVGDSMLPTLAHHELLLVRRSLYRVTDPQRGDVVLARIGREFLVKRVVGLPGEQVEVCKGTLLINGEPCREPYTEPGLLTIPRAKLRADQFALVGDNRALPEAIAMHGVAPKDAIVGKVIFSVRL